MAKELLRICLAQFNITVGDLKENTAKIISSIKEAENQKAHIICFPELAITGYPPEDLLLRPKFVNDNLKALNKVVRNTKNILVIVGFVDLNISRTYLQTSIDKPQHLFNAAALINDKKILAVYHKTCLPNYGVFDEKRYFTPGNTTSLVNVNGVNAGVTICEDIWLTSGPLQEMAKRGAQLILNINASPYHKRKSYIRQDILQKQAKLNKVVIIYNNLVGGQDELVFDGHSMIFNNKGDLIASLSQFKEELKFVDLQIEKSGKPVPIQVNFSTKKDQQTKTNFPDESKSVTEYEAAPKTPYRNNIVKKIDYKPSITPLLGEEEEVYTALKLGLHDYIYKNNFKKVLIGLSGGIDSALTSTIAVDALGPKKVTAITMPSQYTSKESIEDATLLSKNLNINLLNIPIDNINKSYLSSLHKEFQNTQTGTAEENLQARIRGNILMALSNKFGHIVLATGNKSELSVGYATLYGDMAGGFSVLKDVYKTLVYKLANYRNSLSKVIPERIINKPPSAELKPNQLDTDSLPPYNILDPILKSYIEEDKSPKKIIKEGFDKQIVARVVKMVDNNEYKRRQAAPGIKITPKAFGRDRRMPITNKYR